MWWTRQRRRGWARQFPVGSPIARRIWRWSWWRRAGGWWGWIWWRSTRSWIGRTIRRCSPPSWRFRRWASASSEHMYRVECPSDAAVWRLTGRGAAGYREGAGAVVRARHDGGRREGPEGNERRPLRPRYETRQRRRTEEACERVEPSPAFAAIRHGGLPERRVHPRRPGTRGHHVPRVLLRNRLFRGHPRVLERPGRRKLSLPPPRALRATAPLGAHPERHAALQRGPADGDRRRIGAPQRFPRKLLPAPLRLQGRRDDRRQAARPGGSALDAGRADGRLRLHRRPALRRLLLAAH